MATIDPQGKIQKVRGGGATQPFQMIFLCIHAVVPPYSISLLDIMHKYTYTGSVTSQIRLRAMNGGGGGEELPIKVWVAK